MSRRHTIVIGLGSLLVVAACASTEQISEDLAAALSAGGTSSAGAAGTVGSDGGASDGTGSAATGSGGTTGTGSGSGTGATPGVTGSGGSVPTMSEGGAAPVVDSGAGNVPAAAGGSRSGSGGAQAGMGGSFDAGSGCPAGEKRCQGDTKCQQVIPSNGCDLGEACTPCAAAPANGYSKCANEMCDFDCLSGFHRNAAGTACDPGNAGGGQGGSLGAGGSGAGGRNRGGRNGSGGAGGSTGTCSPRNCPSCQNILEAPCCRSNDTCGCGLLGLLCGG